VECLNILIARLRGLLRRDSVLEDIEEEMRSHIEMDSEANVERGMRPEQARLAAMRSFGNLGRIRDLAYEVRGGGLLEALLQDLRYGARMLLTKPGFTLIAVITLALGIGANTAIFSVVNTVLIRAFPYRDADSLVILWEKNRWNQQNTISPANFFDWQERNNVFEGMAAFADIRTNITSDGEPEEIPAQIATDNLFSVLGVNEVLGRTFAPEDSRPGQNNVVIISSGLWQRRFGGDPGVVGRKVILDSVEKTIIGVLPPDIKWHVRKNSLTGKAAELWVPWAIGNELRQHRGRFIGAVARLKPGANIAQARTEMETIAQRLAEEHEQFNSGFGVNVTSLREQFAGEIRLALLVLMCAVGLVLLLACANVANLLLSQATARKTEIVLRTALGAGRGRIVRQLLTESLLLAAMGGAAGLLLAWWGTKVLVSISPPELGDFQNIEISASVLGFTSVVAFFTGVVFGLAPALETTNIKLSDMLKAAGRSLAGNARSQRLGGALIVAEVALALVLLVGAGLLIRSFLRLQGASTGFNARNVLTMRVVLPSARYGEDAKRIRFFTEALERIQALPEVESAGAISFTPFVGLGARTVFEIEGRPKWLAGERMGTGACVTDLNFFRALRIPLNRGRLFTRQEVQEKHNVVIVNEALAKKYFPNEDPLGQRITISMGPPNVPTEIIGIVGDVKHTKLDQEAEPMAYWPISQEPYNFMTFLVQTRGDATAVATAVRNVIQTLDPQQPVADVRTLEDLIGNSIAKQRFNTLLLAIFAAVALFLSAIGIYGVISSSIAQRRHEIGIRTALGASASDILRLVVKRGMTLTLLGMAVGLAASIALTGLIKSLLFGVSAIDPVTFATITLLLAFLALLACLVPARRATKADPMMALRHE
jgi:putative ABC transport system permease protein